MAEQGDTQKIGDGHAPDSAAGGFGRQRCDVQNGWVASPTATFLLGTHGQVRPAHLGRRYQRVYLPEERGPCAKVTSDIGVNAPLVFR